MSRECCGPEEPIVPEPVDACCGPSAPAGHDDEHEDVPPWWRDRALALPVASGLLWVTGLILEWTGLENAALVVFALGLAAGAWTFVPGTIKRLFTAKGRGRLGVGLLMTIVGAIVGGFFLLRVKLSSAVIGFGVLQLVSNFGFYALAQLGADAWGTLTVPAFNVLVVKLPEPTPMDSLLLFALSLDNFAGGMGTAAFVALLTGLCGTRFSATHYALLSAFASLGRVFVGPPAGVMADAWGWPVFFLVSVVVGVPGLVMAWWMRAQVDATMQHASEQTRCTVTMGR